MYSFLGLFGIVEVYFLSLIEFFDFWVFLSFSKIFLGFLGTYEKFMIYC